VIPQGIAWRRIGTLLVTRAELERKIGEPEDDVWQLRLPCGLDLAIVDDGRELAIYGEEAAE